MGLCVFMYSSIAAAVGHMKLFLFFSPLNGTRVDICS